MMAGEATDSISHFLAELGAGDASAAYHLWNRFLPRLLGLARKTLAGRPQRAGDANDVVQSAFVSFWKWLGKGDFPEMLKRDDLWNLLAQLTVRKALRHMRREGAQKRGGGKVLDEAALTGANGLPQSLDEFAGTLPAADFDLYCEEMLLLLEEELRAFAILRLLGYRNREIAERLDCTERTVERKLTLIRLVLERAWPD